MELGSVVTPIFWFGFIAFVLVMLALDLFVLGGRRAHRVSAREALTWTGVWVTLSLSFCALLWWWLDGEFGRAVANQKAIEFLTGYLVELSLSLDNIFVFIMIFTYFAVPAEYQRRVLIYGVLGAIVMRATMILGGVWLVNQFHWVLYLFGAFLVITGFKMLIFAQAETDLARNPVLKWMRNHLRITHEYHEERFTVLKDGVRWFTPLFLVLVLIETSGVIFAVDSIPAIFAITRDPFIVFTSNIFAIMGLRSMYFLLADMNDRFHLLKYGLAMVLIFVGTRILIVDFYKVPIGLVLGLVALILVSSVAASLWATRRHNAKEVS